jgi:DnaJ-class molecular chaperone
VRVPESPDPYAVLGVPATATPEEIGRAYRRLARSLHPDTAGDQASAARFAEASAAYALLSDPTRRREHDRRSGAGLPRRRGRGAVQVPVRRPPRAVTALVSWPQAVLGTQVSVGGPDGPLVVAVPAGTLDGTVLAVPTRSGELAVTVRIHVPRSLTPEQRAAVEALAALLPAPPAAG